MSTVLVTQDIKMLMAEMPTTSQPGLAFFQKLFSTNAKKKCSTTKAAARVSWNFLTDKTNLDTSLSPPKTRSENSSKCQTTTECSYNKVGPRCSTPLS